MPTQQQSKSSSSKISNAEWGLVIGAIVCIDLIQVLLDFVVLGALLNRFIDIIVGMALPFYFWIRNVKMDSKRVLTWIGSFALEEIPAVDALPLWTLDVLATMAWDKADNKLPNFPI